MIILITITVIFLPSGEKGLFKKKKGGGCVYIDIFRTWTHYFGEGVVTEFWRNLRHLLTFTKGGRVWGHQLKKLLPAEAGDCKSVCLWNADQSILVIPVPRVPLCPKFLPLNNIKRLLFWNLGKFELHLNDKSRKWPTVFILGKYTFTLCFNYFDPFPRKILYGFLLFSILSSGLWTSLSLSRKLVSITFWIGFFPPLTRWPLFKNYFCFLSHTTLKWLFQ